MANIEDDAKISVSVKALYEVLTALNGPGYLIGELQATRDPILAKVSGRENPINVLVRELNEYVADLESKEKGA